MWACFAGFTRGGYLRTKRVRYRRTGWRRGTLAAGRVEGIRYTLDVNQQSGQDDAAGAAMAAAGERAPWWSVLGWASYLACSWTWCIGMFLPVLLVRDYGIWGFVVFAVPNVIGAGAMGWVLKKGMSERIVERHRAACAAFSIVTVAFQMYFAGWFLFRLDWLRGYSDQYPLVLSLVAATIVCVPIVWMMIRSKRSFFRIAMAVLVLVVSGLAAWLLIGRGLLSAWTERVFDGLSRSHGGNGLVWMVPVCVFGFASCPYLDLTFLRARAGQGATSARASFTIGFGVLFCSMILLTLAYAPTALGAMGYPIMRLVPAALLAPLAVHLFAQLCATIAFHLDEILRLPRGVSRPAAGALLLSLIVVGVVCGNVGTAVYHEMLVGEIIYRCFMSFYGLVFPAYVWLCMIPTRDGHSGTHGERGRRKLVVCAAACVLAAPCYWMGFIERVEWWLAPGLGVVLVARLLVRKKALGTGH